MNTSVNGGTRGGILTGWGVTFGFRLAGGGYLIWLGVKSLKGSAVNMAMPERNEPETIADWHFFRLMLRSPTFCYCPDEGGIGVLTYTFTEAFSLPKPL
jgi:threonine/homoserine/homoserine lactone efflux protein